jgi:glucose/arabinose dehydrogenase
MKRWFWFFCFLFCFHLSFAQITFPNITLEPYLENLHLPIYATMPDDDTGRIFIVALDGHIYIVKNGKHFPLPFLDLDGIATAMEAEQGMYSMAFHPDYKTNRRFFVSYIEMGSNDLVIREYKAYKNVPDFADPKSAKEMLRFSPANPFHQGGQLAFGPDGYLYISIGDGGQPLVEPFEGYDVAQKLDTFAGKVLRIDVDKADLKNNLPYTIPSDNPFVKIPGAKGEIFALGFRNPWKFGFDRETGELYLGDVGNYDWEEINVVKKGGNYGWPYKEGPVCFIFPIDKSLADPKCRGSNRYNHPLFTYGHVAFRPDGGNAITGGYVYRGEKYPSMQGLYFYGDWTNGRIWALTYNVYGVSNRLMFESGQQLFSFFEDLDGELYVTTLMGNMYHIVPESASNP